MDARIPTTRTNALSNLATQPLERRTLTAFESTHFQRKIGPDFAHLRSPLQHPQSELFRLGSPTQRLGALDPRVSAAVTHPVVDTALLRHKLPPENKKQGYDVQCQETQQAEKQEWLWDELDDGCYDDKGRFVRRVRVRDGGKSRSVARECPQVPSHRPHRDYLLTGPWGEGGQLFPFHGTLRSEIWDDPDDSSCILIRRERVKDETEGPDEADPASQASGHASVSSETEISPHNGHQYIQEGLSTKARDIGTPTLKTLLISSPTKLGHLTYTISEDRSGDSGSVIRQLLSALQSERLAFLEPVVGGSGTPRYQKPTFVTRDWDDSYSELREVFDLYLPGARTRTVVTVKYVKPTCVGWTIFPESLVCAKALKQLGYSHQKIYDGTAFDLAHLFLPSQVEEIVALSKIYSNVTEPKDPAEMVVHAIWLGDPPIASSRGWTEVPSKDIDNKTLIDLGLPFRSQDSTTTIVEKPLSGLELRKIFERPVYLRD